MKTILLPLIVAGAAAVAVVVPELENQRGKGKDKSKPKDSYEDSKDSSKETRKTSAETYWTEDTNPIPVTVPEPSSPLVLLTLAGAALLMTRNK